MRKLPFTQTGPLPRHLGTFRALANPAPVVRKRDWYWLAVAVLTACAYAVVRAI